MASLWMPKKRQALILAAAVAPMPQRLVFRDSVPSMEETKLKRIATDTCLKLPRWGDEGDCLMVMVMLMNMIMALKAFLCL